MVIVPMKAEGLRWPAHTQLIVLSFPDKSTLDGRKVWMTWKSELEAGSARGSRYLFSLCAATHHLSAYISLIAG